MGKIKRFFQKTGVALAVLAATVIGAIKLSPPLASVSFFSDGVAILAGIAGASVLMIGCGIGKAIQTSKENKLLKQYNEPQIENPGKKESFAQGAKNTAQNFGNGFNNGYNNARNNNNNNYNDFGKKVGEAAEKFGEKIGEGANNLGVKLNEIFSSNGRPNTSANPYSSTVNNGSNPYSSRDRMSAGVGGTYNGRQYGSSPTGDVRNAQQTYNNGGGYYSGQGRQGQNGRGSRSGRGGQNGYNNNRNTYNNGYNNRNVQYGGSNNSYQNNNGYNNQNVQYGNYQNGGTQNGQGNNRNYTNNTNIPNTSGLEESAKTNYFENEPGSSTYRSGPLKKEKI